MAPGLEINNYPIWSSADQQLLQSKEVQEFELGELSSDQSESVPAWESDPQVWDFDAAKMVAEKLLALDTATFDEKVQTVGINYALQGSTMEGSMYGLEMDTISVIEPNPRFKTEFCRNFREKGSCVYGDNCQFAHGKGELRQDVVRHSKYKTKLCQKFWINGYCAYGARCNFIHQDDDNDKPEVGGFRPFLRKNSESSNDSGFEGLKSNGSYPLPTKMQPIDRKVGGLSSNQQRPISYLAAASTGLRDVNCNDYSWNQSSSTLNANAKEFRLGTKDKSAEKRPSYGSELIRAGLGGLPSGYSATSGLYSCGLDGPEKDSVPHPEYNPIQGLETGLAHIDLDRKRSVYSPWREINF